MNRGVSEAIHAAFGDLWISDSVIEGGVQACAVTKTGNGPRLGRCTLLDYGTNYMGAAVVAPLLAVRWIAPLQPGSLFTLQYQTVANGLVTTFARAALETVDVAAPIEQPVALGFLGLIDAGTLLADASGHASASWTIPANPVLIDTTLWLQGVTSLSLPLQLSPVVGGLVR